MAKYSLDHPKRMVLVDGTIRIDSPMPLKVRLSRLLSPQGQQLQADPQLIAFANLMREPKTGKRVHPDIADMGPRALAVKDDWGWFEIKPMADIRLAIEEVFLCHLPLWNSEVVARQPEWEKTAGVWQPTMISVTPKYSYIFAAVIVFPGTIGYLTYDLKDAALAAEAAIITAIAALFVQRMIAALRDIGKDAIEGIAALAEFVLAWASLLGVAVAAVLAAIALIPEEAVVGAGATLTALAARSRH